MVRMIFRGKFPGFFYANAPKAEDRTWRVFMQNEVVGFWTFAFFAAIPIAPAFSYYVHKFFGFDMNEIPATTAGGTTGFMNVLPQPLAPRRGDNDIGFVYEYQYADGTKQIKHDYHQKQ